MEAGETIETYRVCLRVQRMSDGEVADHQYWFRRDERGTWTISPRGSNLVVPCTRHSPTAAAATDMMMCRLFGTCDPRHGQAQATGSD